MTHRAIRLFQQLKPVADVLVGHIGIVGLLLLGLCIPSYHRQFMVYGYLRQRPGGIVHHVLSVQCIVGSLDNLAWNVGVVGHVRKIPIPPILSCRSPTLLAGTLRALNDNPRPVGSAIPESLDPATASQLACLDVAIFMVPAMPTLVRQDKKHAVLL